MNSDKELLRASEWYNKRPVLRATIASISPIGTFIDTYFSVHGQIYSSQRIEKALLQLNDKISHLIDRDEFKEYLDSEDFFDLIVAYFEKAIKTKCQEKIKAYANVVMNSITISLNPSINDQIEYENIDFIQMIYELNSYELNILIILIKTENLNSRQSEKFQAGEKVQSTIDIIINEKPLLKRNMVLSSLNRLESKGLLSSYELGFSLGKRDKSYFEYTDLFHQLKSYLVDFSKNSSLHQPKKEEL